MAASHSVFLLLGVALCAVVLVQLGLWATQSLSLLMHNRKQFELSRQLMLQQIERVIEQRVELSDSVAASVVDAAHKLKNRLPRSGSWAGFRSFTVAHTLKETENITSLYLAPEDGKRIAPFRPGQHITLKVPVPGKSKPVIRCYSLSSGAVIDDPPGGIHEPCYRISVKALSVSSPATDEHPSTTHHGLASTFLNQSIAKGDRIEIKAPSGNFWMDESSQMPLVMLAGGIGITPMISMLEKLKSTGSQRSATLFYGVRNSREQAFAGYLRALSASMPNIHMINCYSQPLPEDLPEKQFQVRGYITIDLLQQVLPNNQYQFYLCGPPPFMESLYQGLMDWQVPQDRIRYEAFGPASIGRQKTSDDRTTNSQHDQIDPVTFSRAGKTVLWSEKADSLLELAEANGLFPDSGCRAGSCGSCETALISGNVTYAEGAKPECLAGKCLICIARPNGPVELDL